MNKEQRSKKAGFERSLVIYAFTSAAELLEAEKTGHLAVKVGDTTQGLDEGLGAEECAWLRMNQYKTADKQKKILVGTWLVDKNHIKRDHDLHKVFKLEGRRPAELDGGKEWFYFDKSPDIAKQQIETTIESFGQSARTVVTLRAEQKRTLDEAAQIVYNTTGDRVDIAANLPPRFGKTIWALMMFKRLATQMNHDTMILPACWLSSHSSFMQELKTFRQFRDMVWIDTKDEGWEIELHNAHADGKKAVVAVSLFIENHYKLKPLRDIDNGYKFVCIDEGDFGAWTPRSRKVLNYILNGPTRAGGKMVVMPMSGTNISRMVTGADHVDGLVQTTYMELENTEPGMIRRRYVRLRLDGTDKYVSELTKESVFSWSKTWANVTKSQNFLTNFLQGIFAETDNQSYADLSLSNMMDEPITVAMMFTSATKKEMAKFKLIADRALPTTRVLIVNGDETTNREAEYEVKRAIAEAQNAGQTGVLIVSRAMGSRSFSVSQVQACLLCYDKGGIDPTVQKAARCLTPGHKWDDSAKEYGYIVSCSIDPNRDETPVQMLTEEAVIQSNVTGEDLPTVVKQLLRNVSILSTDEYGNVVSFDEGDLIEELTSSQTLHKVAVAMSNPMAVLDDDDLMEMVMAVMATKANKKKIDALLPEAQTYIRTGIPKKGSTSAKKLETLIRERLETLNGSAAMVALLGAGRTYRECLLNIDDPAGFESRYGVSPEGVITLLDHDVLPENLLDIIVANSCNLLDNLGDSCYNGKIDTLKKFQELDHLGDNKDIGVSSGNEEAKIWRSKVSDMEWDENTNFLSVATGMGYEVTALLEAGVSIDQITIVDMSGFGKVWENAGIEYHNKDFLQELMS